MQPIFCIQSDAPKARLKPRHTSYCTPEDAKANAFLAFTGTVSLRCISVASNHRQHFRLVNLYSVGAEEGFGFGEEAVRYGGEVLAGGFYVGVAAVRG